MIKMCKTEEILVYVYIIDKSLLDHFKIHESVSVKSLARGKKKTNRGKKLARK